MLNSKTTTTVRIAQTEYRLRPLNGSFKKISSETSIKAKPILAEKTIFLGSDRPICHALAATSWNFLKDSETLSQNDRQEKQQQLQLRVVDEDGCCSSSSSWWMSCMLMKPNPSLWDNNLSLSLFSAKEYLNDPNFAVIIVQNNSRERKFRREREREGRKYLEDELFITDALLSESIYHYCPCFRERMFKILGERERQSLCCCVVLQLRNVVLMCKEFGFFYFFGVVFCWTKWVVVVVSFYWRLRVRSSR